MVKNLYIESDRIKKILEVKILTEEELTAEIEKIIIFQEKPKSTGNSHRRKQWENKKYWHLCTKQKSCKLGKVKICELVGNIDRKIIHPRCDDCSCYWQNPRRFERLAGIQFDCNTGRFEKYSYHNKFSRHFAKKHVRRYKEDIGNFSFYKKIFDYEWDCW